METKRCSNFYRLVAVNCAAVGFEVSASVAFTYVPPLLLKTGFSEAAMSVVMGLGPCLALFSVPWLGRWSDNCRSRLGRRRPFILGFLFLLLVALLVIPNVHVITQWLGFPSSSPANLLLMALGVMLMDYATQATWNPCQSLVSDIVNQNPTLPGFTVYSAMISLGSCMGYLLIAINWQEWGITNSSQERTAFIIAALILVIGVAITTVFADEKPLTAVKNSYVFRDDFESTFFSNGSNFGKNVAFKNERKKSSKTSSDCLRKYLRILLTPVNKLFCLPYNLFLELNSAPRVLKKLFIADLIAWIAVNCYLLFFTDFVGQVIYKGVPGAPASSEEFRLYDEGVRMGCRCLLLHSILACLYSAFIQEHVSKRYGLKFTYVSGLFIFTLSMVGLLVTTNLTVIILLAALSGFGFAVSTTVPNSLINLYNGDQKKFYLNHGEISNQEVESVDRGLGQDLAVSDSAYFLSQIILSCFVGVLVEYTGFVQCYILVAAAAGLLATALAAQLVIYAC